MRIYKSKLNELFTGTFIEVQKFCTILEDFDIKYIVQDYKQSAVLAGFGITNLYYTHRLLNDDNIYLKRLTLIVEKKIVKKVFYPIYTIDKHIDNVLRWLKEN